MRCSILICRTILTSGVYKLVNDNNKKRAVLVFAVCVDNCTGKKDGDYQSCYTCSGYVSCSNGHLTDNRDCSESGRDDPLQWDDNELECKFHSTTCDPSYIHFKNRSISDIQ